MPRLRYSLLSIAYAILSKKKSIIITINYLFFNFPRIYIFRRVIFLSSSLMGDLVICNFGHCWSNIKSVGRQSSSSLLSPSISQRVASVSVQTTVLYPILNAWSASMTFIDQYQQPNTVVDCRQYRHLARTSSKDKVVLDSGHIDLVVRKHDVIHKTGSV